MLTDHDEPYRGGSIPLLTENGISFSENFLKAHFYLLFHSFLSHYISNFYPLIHHFTTDVSCFRGMRFFKVIF